MYPNTFAGLVQAAVDAGVPGQAIEEMEARGVSSLETARQALDRGLVSEQLQAYLQALVATAFAFGQQNRSRGAVRTRRDLPVLRHSSGGSMQKALAAALPQNREAALREFQTTSGPGATRGHRTRVGSRGAKSAGNGTCPRCP